VISEKELSCKFGQEVLVGYSEAMHPESYPTFDAFTAAVQKEWDTQWSRVFSADWTSKFPCSLDQSVFGCYIVCSVQVLPLHESNGNFVLCITWAVAVQMLL